MTRRLKRLLLIFLLLFIAGIFSDVLVSAPVAFVIYLFIAWVWYVAWAAARIQVNWELAAMGAACTAGALALGHLLLRWLWRETGGAARNSSWRARWTLIVGGAVALMFICGMAAAGIARHAAWLAASDESLFANSFSRCGERMVRVGAAIRHYAQSHEGHFPVDLRELMLAENLPATTFICPSSMTSESPGQTPAQQAAHLLQGHCDFVYLARGLNWPAPPGRPILIEAPINHQYRGINILFGDGHAEFVPADQARRLIDEVAP